MATKIPQVALEKLSLSRLVCGTNPFMGISHFTMSRDLFLREFFTVERVAEVMGYVYDEFGVNCCLSSPRPKLARAIALVEEEYGYRFQWLCTPSTRGTIDKDHATIETQIAWCGEHGVVVCMPHRDYTDKNLVEDAENPGGMVLRGYERIAGLIRDAGMVPGLSTHYFETIRAVERNGYDVPVVTQPLNLLGFMSTLEVNSLANIIRNTKIQVINIKPLAAGRLLPETGLQFCFSHIKANDLVACGFDNIQNADYDCQLALRLLTE